MKKNMGIADRLIRVLIAVALIVLFATNTISGLLGVITLIFAGIFILTSLIGFCPLYTLFKANTCCKSCECKNNT